MRRTVWAIVVLIGLLAGAMTWVYQTWPMPPSAPLTGMDTGATATQMVAWDQRQMAARARTKPWLRIRGHPMAKDKPEVTEREAVALQQLSQAGFKPVIFLRWGEKSWTNGTRPGGGQRLPLDLREAYQRGYDEGRLFGHTGAAFEIENEPDISFVQDNAETYMAFLKAVYLGIKASSLREYGGPSGRSDSGTVGLSDRLTGVPASVIMSPLALPPGPYFERMVANGLFSYTDAFNYHYYGYAEDFVGVYRQFEAATATPAVTVGRSDGRTVGRSSGSHLQAPRSESKTLPVLLSEYGYGALGKDARDTVEGRVRQWRWFKSVGEDIARLRIAGPMAFYLPPYLERDQLEFGLTMRAPREHSQTVGPSDRLHFSPENFGETAAAPWMRRIGERFGENEATPALAWLMEEGAKRPYVPKDWTVSAPPPSPVVITFIAGDGLAQAKRYGGYVAQRMSVQPPPPPAAPARPAPPPVAKKPPAGPPPAPSPGLPPGYIPPLTWFGTGTIVLYNFSDETITGRLHIDRGHDVLLNPAALDREWTLAPMSRTVVEINLRIPAFQFTRQELAVRFEQGGSQSEHGRTVGPSDRIAPAIFTTAFFPNFPRMRESMVHDFGRTVVRSDGPAVEQSDSPNVRRSTVPPSDRPLATEEPRLEAQGRWWVTKGVRVEEAEGRRWRFHIDQFPDAPEKSAVAELPLPADFRFPPSTFLRFFYRLAQPAGTTGENGKYMEAYFRTANGNLYQVWPRQLATDAWSEYAEAKENYTMAFYGRANLPWRFQDNQPVALVFFFRPLGALPAVYEVKDARVVGVGN